VRVLRSPQEGDRLIDGEVLVAPMTNPDWLPTIRRAAGLVTDTGGMTCHADRGSRARHSVRGRRALDDGRSAVRHVGDRRREAWPGDRGAPAAEQTSVSERREPVAVAAAGEVTATKIYVKLAMPDTAEAVAAQDADGVGLLRAEFMVTQALDGRHPCDLIAHGEQGHLVESMAASSAASLRRSTRDRLCTGQRTSAPTSSGGYKAGRHTNPSNTTR
jgi:pyruvate, water dikinase